jgi:2-amino-4-hydroxy-6-hydroxymethyldihydropteridine diphosphokinase
MQLENISSVWESEPVGPANQPDFWNLVVQGRTLLDPQALLAAIKEIERRLGRTPTWPQGPRLIDIDILLYGDAQMQDSVEIPHPRMLQRAFVLRPLLELDAEVTHPVTGERIADRLALGSFERIRRLFPGNQLQASGDT